MRNWAYVETGSVLSCCTVILCDLWSENLCEPYIGSQLTLLFHVLCHMLSVCSYSRHNSWFKMQT